MAVILVDIQDTFDQWRVKTNNISIGVGDHRTLNSGNSTVVRAVNTNWTNIGTLSALTTSLKDTLVNAINEIDFNTDTNTVSIGVLANLDTTDKSSLVNAVNEVVTELGDLSLLTTDAKTDLVSAINEVDDHTDTNTDNIGDVTQLPWLPGMTDLVENIGANFAMLEQISLLIGTPGDMPLPYPGNTMVENLVALDDDITALETIVGSDVLNTTATYTTGAINELLAITAQIGDLTLLETEEQGTLVGAINEINATVNTSAANVGDLLLLETGSKDTLVNAINEVATNAIVMALILG